MDVPSSLDGQNFIWDIEKATANFAKHRVRFDRAREVFLDQLAQYEDAGPPHDPRQACVGLTRDYHLLLVVHVVRDNDVIRIISARPAEPQERKRYEND